MSSAPHSAVTPSSPTGSALQGSLGVSAIVFLVVAAAAPLTAIAGAMPVAFAIGDGAGLPTAYIVCAVVLLLFSVGYAAMSRHVVDAGAFSAYATTGLGRRAGRGAAWLALLTYTAIQAAVYGLAGATASGLVTAFGGPQLPWWGCAAVLLLVVAALGYRNIDLGAKVLGVLLVLEMGIVALLVIGVFAGAKPEGWSLSAFTPSTFLSGSPGIAIMFAVASFIGFEATAIYGEEAKDPVRTVPRATYAAVLLIGVFYALAAWAVTLYVGPSQVVSTATDHLAAGDLLFVVAGGALGGWAATVMQVLLMTSLFAALLAFHNAIARYLYSLGRSGGAHASLGVTHDRHGSPHRGSLVQTVSAVLVVGAFAVAGADPVAGLFTWLSGLASLAILVLMLVVSAAIVVFFRRRPDADRRVWNTRVAPVLGLVGLAAVAALLLDNFTTLIGGSTAIAVALVLLVAVTFVLGALLSPSADRASTSPSDTTAVPSPAPTTGSPA